MRTETEQEILTRTDQQKAEVLGSCFSSVFTSEPDGAIPTLEPRNADTPLDDILVTAAQVKDKLMKLKIDKLPGPDAMHTKILREASEEISQALAIIYNTALQTGTCTLPDYRKNGRQLGHVTVIFAYRCEKKLQTSQPDQHCM